MINSINSTSSYAYASVTPRAQQSGELSTTQSKYIPIPDGISSSKANSASNSQVQEQNNSSSDQTKPINQTDHSTDPVSAQRELDAVISQLKARDLEVKVHEQAHLAAGGQYVTGGASYVYQVGPDGRRYAIGGEVSIDTSPIEGDPEATLMKALQVQAAALAPSEPSSQDYKVAQAAQSMASSARSEISGSQNDDSKDALTSDLSSNSSTTDKADQSQEKPNQIAFTENNNPLLNSDRNQFELRQLIA